MRKGVDIFRLDGKTALLTGATGYLGRAMAFALAEAGAHVLINSRSADRAKALVGELADAELSAEAAVFDVTSQDAVHHYFRSKPNTSLNVLINNAYAGGAGSIKSSSAEDYATSYDVTVVSAHALVRSALPALRAAFQKDGDASIINIASMYAVVSPDQRVYAKEQLANPPFYGAAKAALVQWSRYAACELGPEGIRVNAISPGPFPSGQVTRNNPQFVELLKHKVPLGRVGNAEELKGAVLFLASPSASFVNGSNLIVDGGWTCW